MSACMLPIWQQKSFSVTLMLLLLLSLQLLLLSSSLLLLLLLFCYWCFCSKKPELDKNQMNELVAMRPVIFRRNIQISSCVMARFFGSG